MITVNGSPDKLRTDLPNARVAGTGDVAEVAVADVSGRVVKLRMIEDVEEFTSNLEVHCFIDGNHLRYAQIGVVESWAVKESPVRSPERSAVSARQNPRVRRPIWVCQIAGSCNKCALVKICMRASIARVVNVNRSHDIWHISGRATSKRGVSYAQRRRIRRVRHGVKLSTQAGRIPVAHLDRKSG